MKLVCCQDRHMRHLLRNYNKRFTKPKLSRVDFTICHYAGDVTYQTELFLDKNKDYVVAEHQALLSASKCSFVAGMHSDVATLRKYSLWHEVSRIVREEGFGGFWKGNLVTIVHRLPYSAISFYSYERYKKFFQMIPGLDRDSNYVGVARLLGGGLAGVTAASVTYPLDVVCTRLATQKTTRYYKGIFHALSTICRDEGVKGLYKGLGATLLGVGPSIAIGFSVYESLRSRWQMERGGSKGPPGWAVARASWATSSLYMGLDAALQRSPLSTVATFPLDLVKRRMQLHGAAGTASVYKSSITGTVCQIFQKEGLRGFYRGIVPEYLKVVPSVGIAFMTYETLKSLLSSTDTDDEN